MEPWVVADSLWLAKQSRAHFYEIIKSSQLLYYATWSQTTHETHVLLLLIWIKAPHRLFFLFEFLAGKESKNDPHTKKRTWIWVRWCNFQKFLTIFLRFFLWKLSRSVPEKCEWLQSKLSRRVSNFQRLRNFRRSFTAWANWTWDFRLFYGKRLNHYAIKCTRLFFCLLKTKN